MHPLNLILAMALAGIGSYLQPQRLAAQSLIRQFDSLARHQQWVADIPGYVVAVVSGEKVIYEKALGVVNTATRKPVDRYSDYHMASVSKPFAATAILQLFDRGKLHLDSTLVSYLPEFSMKDPRYKTITLYHILTHSSGIPDVTNYEWDRPQTDGQSALRYAKDFAESTLDFAPGSGFGYSNAAYDLLAAVIQKVTGQTFEDYIKQEILVPAGMLKSSFLLSDIARANFTEPHELNTKLIFTPAKTYPYNRIHAPSSTLHSNLTDMIDWVRLFLREGSSKGRTIIRQDTWKKMLVPQRTVTDRYKVCLSWFEVEIEGRKVYFHSGGDVGYRSFVGFCPEEKVGVVLMGNNDLFDGAQAGFVYFQTLFTGKIPVLPLKAAQRELRKHILNGGMDQVKKVYAGMKKEQPLRYDTTGSGILELAGMLFERNHRQQATDVLLWGSSLYPGDGSWYGHLGDIHAVWKENDKAMDYYRKAMKLMTTEQRKEVEEKMEALER
ncbi:beta-lactamase family protein [Nostoc ellipsosporum NOK]|nr:beta-lactamase family protein [Nostoc ellipsosporum NOK]